MSSSPRISGVPEQARDSRTRYDLVAYCSGFNRMCVCSQRCVSAAFFRLQPEPNENVDARLQVAECTDVAGVPGGVSCHAITVLLGHLLQPLHLALQPTKSAQIRSFASGSPPLLACHCPGAPLG